jgi:hypothetical protein
MATNPELAVIEALTFEGVRTYQSAGNEIQIARTNYRGIEVIERTFFPWNIFKPAVAIYIPDIIIGEGSPLASFVRSNSEMMMLTDCYYTDPGFFMVDCKSLEAAISLINKFKDLVK